MLSMNSGDKMEWNGSARLETLLQDNHRSLYFAQFHTMRLHLIFFFFIIPVDQQVVLKPVFCIIYSI